MRLSSPRCRVKLEEGVFEGVVQLHDGGLVPAPVAVVGGGEDGDDVPVVRPVVTLHHQLMGSADQGQTIRMVECLRYVLAEGVSSTTGRDAPASSVVRVGPEQVAHGAFMRNLL